MFNPPNLFQGRQLAERRSQFTGMFGMPDNWMDAERTLNEMRPQQNRAGEEGQRSGGGMQPTSGRLIPPSAGPMKRTNPMTGSARYFGVTPTGAGQVPAGIMAANPEAYFNPKTGAIALGDPNRVGIRNVGGNTWSGNAMKDGTVMNNTNNATFGMPAPNERRGSIGGGGMASPDMFGRNFGGGKASAGPDPFAAAPDLDPASPYYDASAAQKARVAAFGGKGFADGGPVFGPGGPKDDMVPAMLSDGEFIIPAAAVRRIGTDRLEKMIEPPDMEKKKPKAPPSMHGGMMHMAAGGFVNPDTLDAISQSATRARINDGLSPVPFGPTMNDHPAFQPPQPMAFGVQPPVMQASPIPAFAPTFEPQAPVPSFAPRFVGQPGTGNPAPGTSPTPFLAPWEKDAARAAAADAASGRPEGVRKSDWRNFMRSPQGMMFNIQRQDQAAQDAQRERVRLDEQAVAVNRDLFRTNTGIQMDAMNRAASREDAANARAVDENYRMAAENRKIGNEAAMRAAENNMPPQDIPGTDYVRTAYGNLPKTRPAPTAPPGMEPESMIINGVRYAKPKAATAATDGVRGTKEIDGILYNMTKTGELQRAPIKNPTPQVKAQIFKHVTGREPASDADWTEAHYLTTGDERKQPAAPAANEKAASLRSKYGY